MTKLSIVIPTSGRPTLYTTLSSVLAAGISDDDEVLVIADGPQPEAQAISAFLRHRFRSLSYRELIPRANNFGHAPSNAGYLVASGTHILRIDDDDVYVPGALNVVRRVVSGQPDKIAIFRMRAVVKRYLYDVIWREPTIALGNVGTPMIVVPNLKGRVGTWGETYCGDLEFICTTVEKHPDRQGGIVWSEEIIADIH